VEINLQKHKNKPDDQELPLAFVERKELRQERVSEYLQLSTAENQWTNNGPLSRVLQAAYHDYLKLDAEICLYACANCTVALEAMVRHFDKEAGRKLKWVTSAFSFHNLNRGYFNDSTIIDCDDHGLLSLDELNELQRDSFDGLIVTNIFGQLRNIRPYTRFCQEHGKN
jgi:dTDP-4-amino-4,6-dideoxygalactose transaminase